VTRVDTRADFDAHSGAHPRPKRLTLLCQHFYPEMISTGMHMTELALGLRRRGWEVTVVCAQPTLDLDGDAARVPEVMEYEGIRILRVTATGSHARGLIQRLVFAGTYLASTCAAVWRLRRDIDGFLVTTNPPFLGLVGRLARAALGKPYVLLVYDVYPDIAFRMGVLRDRSPLTWIWERVSRFMLNGARAVVVIGGDMAACVRRKLRPTHWGRLRVIANWADEDVVAPAKTRDNPFRVEHGLQDRIVVQYSGRLGATHNLEPLIYAAALVRERRIFIQIIGGGAKKLRLQQLVGELGLDNVQFLPYQPRERLGDVLSAADLAVVCLEGRFTGLSVPSKAYGVMASATAILGFLDPESEIGRTVVENDCGVVLPDPTGEDVADLIRELVRDPERLKRMGENGYRAFRSQYTLSLAADRYSRLLEQSFYPHDRRGAASRRS
jgi:glycosyltransferase involved in cell wall biosynthesis